MRISEFAVKRYQFTLIIFLMVTALGITTLLTMPRSEDPELSLPIFPVVVVYPGASPEDMEELIVDKLEKKLSELENIREIKTEITVGVAVLRVECKFGTDFDKNYQDIVREVNQERANLPSGITRLEVQRIRPSNVNILQMALVSENAPFEVLKRESERLEDALKLLPTLKDIKTQGLPNKVVRVDLRLDKLAELGIPLRAVVGSIQSELANIPGGDLVSGKKSFSVKTSGNYKSLQEVENTIVYSTFNSAVALKDIANVYSSYETQTHITRLNGHRCVFVTAALKDGNNISAVQKDYQPVLEAYRKDLPKNVDMVLHFEQAEAVNNRLNGLGEDFVFAILLVLITLLPLGGRATAVVMITIPLSLAIGLVMLNALGYNLNQLSIVGLVVALGLVVDDSIVVVENIERWLRRGLKPLDASIVATKQIGLAVLGFTATLVIAFLPLVFLPEGSGEFIRGLPMAVICSVIASMLVSLTITPFLSSRLLKEHVEGYEGNWFLRMLQKLISGSYSRLLEWSLRRPVVTLIIVSVIFVGSLSLIPVLGFSLFPSSEKPQFFINVNPEQQSSLTATNNIVKGVEAILDTMNEVQYYATNVGKGNPQIYYNEIQQNEKNDFAQIFVQLNAEIKAEEKLLIIEKLRKRFASLPDARIEVRNFEQGPPVVAPIEVRLKGDNLDTLRMLAERVEEKLKRTPGTLYVESPITILKSDLRVKIDIPKARLYNLNSVDIDMNVRMAIAGLEAGSFTDPVTNDEVKILLTLPRGENATTEVFDKLYINNQTGQSIPLRQVATPVLETSFLSINHFDKVRTVGITAYVQKDAPKSDVIGKVVKDMKTFPLPKGYTYQMGGEVESASRSFAGFGTIILLTVFLFTAVLILEFGTFKSTLIVLSVIPLGMVGALLALWMSGDTLSFVAVIGIIALAGIEVKNSILLVDFTNQLREQGYTLHDAIREAGEQRFLPIILTSLTAIGGLTPIVLSGNPLISPLAVVIIGGLVSSTILSRIVTPVVYMLIPPHVEVKSQEQLY